MHSTVRFLMLKLGGGINYICEHAVIKETKFISLVIIAISIII